VVRIISYRQSPQEAAHLIAKLQAGICRRDGTMESRGSTRHQYSPPGTDDIAHRFAIFVRRPGQQGRASFFDARIASACAIVQQSRLLEPFSDQTRGSSTQQQTKTTGSKVLQQFLRGRQKANPSEAAQ
jgi:hypothetical protein